MQDSNQPQNKIVEFLTVLAFAIFVGGGAMLSVMYLNGAWQVAALSAIAIITIASWSLLRKKFHRI